MEFLEIPLIDDDIFKMLVRFGFNLIFMATILVVAIYPSQRDREFAFTAIMMNITVFFICFTLKKFELGIGMALGLFAIFGVLRYRTDAIRTKEMTYLFIVIGIAVINSLSNKKTSYGELIAVNGIIVAAACLNEQFVARGLAVTQSQIDSDLALAKLQKKKQRKTTITYDKLDFLSPAKQAELHADLIQRTGIAIDKIRIESIDLKNGLATLSIWYNDQPDPSPSQTV
jgi:hypothetical protein